MGHCQEQLPCREMMRTCVEGRRTKVRCHPPRGTVCVSEWWGRLAEPDVHMMYMMRVTLIRRPKLAEGQQMKF